MLSLDNIASLRLLAPELWITTGILVVLLSGMVFRGERKAVFSAFFSLVAIGGAFLAIIIQADETSTTRFIFSSMAAHDPFAVYFKVLFTVIAFITVLISVSSVELVRRHRTEYFVLVLGMLLGMMLLASSTDLIMLYLALELVSLPAYMLTAFSRTDRFGAEAALKYVIYGAVSSGIMLFGMSIIYGIAGTTSLHGIMTCLSGNAPFPGAVFIALVMILAGIGYKVAFVPFHFWCPDIYQGAPTPVTAYLSVGSKAAGFAMLLRVLLTGFAEFEGNGSISCLSQTEWPLLIGILSVITMTLGNLAAINQTNLKRLLAYSSIAHAGYLLMGVAAISFAGIESVLFYLFVYAFMNLGAFYVLITYANKLRSYEIDDYRGVGWRSPFLGSVMVIFLVSLAGLPPVLGFIGKFYIFAAVMHEGLYWLAAAGILNSVFALFYYARIFKAMWLEKPEENEEAIPVGGLNLVLNGMLAAVILLFPLYWEPLAKLVKISSQLAVF